MKLYIFYRIKDARGCVLDVPELYGFTNKKKLRDDFKEQRNMDIFHLIVKDVNETFIKDFIDRYKHRELSYQKMYTRNPINPMDKTTIEVLTCWAEIDRIMTKADIIFDELKRYVNPAIFYLKTEYIEALDDLYYLTVCKFSKPQLNTPSFAGLEDYSNEKGILQSNLDYDEFALYMYYVAYTYK